MAENNAHEAGAAVAGFKPSDFDWIVDKNLLRDEGVFFGLSEYDNTPMEKLETIRQFFMERIRILEKSIVAHSRELDKQEMRIADHRHNIAQRKEESHTSPPPASRPHEFWRNAVGLAIYLCMVLYNFWLIQGWLLAAGLAHSTLTAVGVYLFGSLCLYSRFSLLYHAESEVLSSEGDRRERWKVYVEEFVVPLVATLYIAHKGAADHAMAEILLFSLFVYFLFLFAGKGLLNQWTALRRGLSLIGQNRIDKKMYKASQQQRTEEILRLEQELVQIQAETTATRRHLLDDERNLAMLHEQKETNVALFLSEFELARTSRQNMNRRQIAQIISNRR